MSQDTRSYNLLTELPQLNGALQYEDMGSRTLAGRTTLATALIVEVESLVPAFAGLIGSPGPEESSLVLIGSGDDADNELALILTSDVDGYTLRRGVLDTIPWGWPAGTRVWFIGSTLDILDGNLRSAGSTARYKLLTNTSRGQLSEAAAPEVTYAVGERPHLPIRPAAVTVAGELFGPVAVPTGDVDVAWAERNRFEESAPLQAWDDGTITPEAGQTTTIAIFDLDGAVVAAIDDFTGTSYSIPRATFAGLDMAYVRVTSKRDGLESLQGMTTLVILSGGYGYSYGYNYGGI